MVDLAAFVGDPEIQIVEDDVVVGELLGEKVGHLVFAAAAAIDAMVFAGDFAKMDLVAGAEDGGHRAHDDAGKGVVLDRRDDAPDGDGEDASPDGEARDLPPAQFAPDGLLLA